MARGKIVFREILQDSQDIGGDDEHMVSVILFNLELEDRTLKDLRSSIKQTIGTNYAKAPLEVEYPPAIVGIVPYDVFRLHAEQYYRDSFGATGRAVNTDSGGHVIMQNNIIQMNKKVAVDIIDPSKTTGW